MHGLSLLIQGEDKWKEEILPPLNLHAYPSEDCQEVPNNIMLVTCGYLASLCVCAAELQGKTPRHHHLWSCHMFRQLYPLRLRSLTRGSVSKNEHNWCVWFKIPDNEGTSYLSLLLSLLSGGSRGPALGYSHYLGDVGLGSGLFSHWQHSLHCHYGKKLQRDAFISHSSISSWYHKHKHSSDKLYSFLKWWRTCPTAVDPKSVGYSLLLLSFYRTQSIISHTKAMMLFWSYILYLFINS